MPARDRPVSETGFRPEVQALRAIAVGLVVLFHAHVPPFNGGYVGVDVFFVISGFLIGGHLIQEQRATGRIRLFSFWARRIRRLLPAALLVVVVTAVAAKLFVAPLALVGLAADARATTLYAANVQFATSGVSYLADQSPSPFQQFWSLSLEEQFYIFWPIFLITCRALGAKHPRAVRATALAIVMTISFGLSVVLTQALQPLAFYLLPTRVWEFGLGTTVAIATPALQRLPARFLSALLPIGIALILISAVAFTSTTEFPGWIAIFPVAGSSLAIMAGSRPLRGIAESVVRNRVLQFVGAISYSIYLWHWPLLVLPTYGTNAVLPLPIALIAVVVCVVLAYATYRWVERPGRSARILRGSALRTYFFAGVAMMICLVVSAGVAIQPPETFNREASPLGVAASSASDLTVTGFVPKNSEPVLSKAAGDMPSIYGDGCHLNLRDTVPRVCVKGDPHGSRTIVLFGDSHAAQWFPPLNEVAKQRHERLLVLTKSACPVVDMRVFSAYFLREYSECDTFRRIALARIVAAEPVEIVMSDATEYSPADDVTIARPAFEARWASSMVRTMSELPPAATKVIISPTPRFQEAVPDCLSAHIDNTNACAAPLDIASARRSVTERTVVGRTSRASYVNAIPWLCPGGRCAVVERNLVMYADNQHLTATYSRLLSGVLAEALPNPGSPSN